MGKFSGYLICSDFDRTFASKGQPVAENLEAIRYFTENGGKFTLATGRLVDFIRQRGMDKVINAPVCLCNGAVIYDYDRNEPIRENKLPYTVDAFLDRVEKYLPMVDRYYIFADMVTGAMSGEDITQVSEEIKASCVLKIVCIFNEETVADEFETLCKEECVFADTYISKASPFGVEFNGKGSTKGDAVAFLKDYLPEIHTTIGVGDYENDIPLLQRADIGAAVQDALPSTLAAADWVVCTCTEGSMWDIVRRIENTLL